MLNELKLLKLVDSSLTYLSDTETSELSEAVLDRLPDRVDLVLFDRADGMYL